MKVAARSADDPTDRSARTIALTWKQESRVRRDRIAAAGNPAQHTRTIVRAYRVDGDGDLDAAALDRAATELLRRHDALRTRIHWAEAENAPLASIGPAPPHVLERRSDARPLEDVLASAATQLERWFDRTAEPLLRLRLVDCTDGRLLVLAVDHLVADGLSLDLIERELVLLYGVAAHGAAAPEPPPDQFWRFAAAERAWSATPEARRAIAAERARLRDVGPLPTYTLADAPSSSAPPTQRRASAVRTIAAAPLRQVRAAASSEGATLFAALCACVGVVLSARRGGQPVGVLYARANRSTLASEQVVGWFADNGVVPIRARPGASLRQPLRDVRDDLFASLEARPVPWALLLHELCPAHFGTPIETPVVHLNYLPGATTAPLRLGDDAVLEPLAVQSQWTDPGLIFSAEDLPDGELRLQLDYERDRYEQPVVEALLADVERALRRVGGSGLDAPIESA